MGVISSVLSCPGQNILLNRNLLFCTSQFCYVFVESMIIQREWAASARALTLFCITKVLDSQNPLSIKKSTQDKLGERPPPPPPRPQAA